MPSEKAPLTTKQICDDILTAYDNNKMIMRPAGEYGWPYIFAYDVGRRAAAKVFSDFIARSDNTLEDLRVMEEVSKSPAVMASIDNPAGFHEQLKQLIAEKMKNSPVDAERISMKMGQSS